MTKMLGRRKFMKTTGGTLTAAGLSQLFLACSSDSESGEDGAGGSGGGDGIEYGPLVEKSGALIALPAGFRYVEIDPVGSKMSDSNEVPGLHDGMAVFSVPGKKSRVRLVRNHELGGVETSQVDDEKSYDSKGPGCVTITEWDMETETVVKNFVALSGTIENCSGGANYDDRWWLTCEESTDGIADGYDEDHGYVFAVPVDAEGLVDAVPLRAMGRFLHEAAVTDPETGVIYMTEDEGPDQLYRFIPDDRRDLTKGGTLWALKIDDEDNLDTGTNQTVGKELSTSWVKIDDPDPKDPEDPERAVFDQGQEKGAALFQGLEGACFADGTLFFTASDGGDEERGQVWKYTAIDEDSGKLELLFESTNKEEMDGPDNLCVAPNGKAIVVCEDGDGGDWIDGDDSCREGGDNFLRVVTQEGKVFALAKVTEPLDLVKADPEDFEEDCTADPLPKEGEVFGASEFAGAAFSPDGKWLFVNVQYPGVTVAITGPWEDGILG